jgi:hypothetical protein
VYLSGSTRVICSFFCNRVLLLYFEKLALGRHGRLRLCTCRGLLLSSDPSLVIGCLACILKSWPTASSFLNKHGRLSLSTCLGPFLPSDPSLVVGCLPCILKSWPSASSSLNRHCRLCLSTCLGPVCHPMLVLQSHASHVTAFYTYIYMYIHYILLVPWLKLHPIQPTTHAPLPHPCPSPVGLGMGWGVRKAEY